MIVTINTDASFHTSFRIGAYAFWIVSNAGKVLHCGSLRDKVNNATEAETKCIINALATLKKQKWEGMSKIVINTDSLNSIFILEKHLKEITKYNLQFGGVLRYQYNKIIEHFPPIEFRHVKAHKSTESARSWVNDWCDKKSKEMLWKQINSRTK